MPEFKAVDVSTPPPPPPSPVPEQLSLDWKPLETVPHLGQQTLDLGPVPEVPVPEVSPVPPPPELNGQASLFESGESQGQLPLDYGPPSRFPEPLPAAKADSSCQAQELVSESQESPGRFEAEALRGSVRVEGSMELSRSVMDPTGQAQALEESADFKPGATLGEERKELEKARSEEREVSSGAEGWQEQNHGGGEAVDHHDSDDVSPRAVPWGTSVADGASDGETQGGRWETFDSAATSIEQKARSGAGEGDQRDLQPADQFDEYFRGGRHRDMLGRGRAGIESHHIPADKSSPLNKMDGPAIQMNKDDHKETASWGSSHAARAYREQQRELIQQGRWDEAVGMDVKDVRRLFGDKYDEALAQRADYESRTRRQIDEALGEE